jgi:hypothetical protein
VTIAFTLTRHFPARDAGAYIAAQLAGAAAGALVLLAAWPDQPAQLGATVPSVGAGTALLYETILTAVLMFVIISVATDTSRGRCERGDRDRRHLRSLTRRSEGSGRWPRFRLPRSAGSRANRDAPYVRSETTREDQRSTTARRRRIAVAGGRPPCRAGDGDRD